MTTAIMFHARALLSAEKISSWYSFVLILESKGLQCSNLCSDNEKV